METRPQELQDGIDALKATGQYLDSDVSALEAMLEDPKCQIFFKAHKNLYADLFAFIQSPASLHEALTRLDIIDRNHLALLNLNYAPLVENTFKMAPVAKQYEHLGTIFEILANTANRAVYDGSLDVRKLIAIEQSPNGNAALALNALNLFLDSDEQAIETEFDNLGLKLPSPRPSIAPDSPLHANSHANDAAKPGCWESVKQKIADRKTANSQEEVTGEKKTAGCTIL